MKNVYDIRLDDQLLFIFPEEYEKKNISSDVLKKCCIAIHLFYEETLDFYFEYINNIPNDITVFIISPKQSVLDKAKQFCKHLNTSYYLKNNRGRDCSALLVELREKILQYEYYCPLHDKRELLDKTKRWKADTTRVLENIWGNSICSKEYISNVITKFEEDEKIGILLTPETLGYYAHLWYGNTWTCRKNYKNCIELAERLGVKADIQRKKKPLLATGCWVRTESMKKLLEYEWKYEDFPDEPFPLDGTISHAIERTAAYIAQDAGYSVGTMMSDKYAAWSLLFLQDTLTELFKIYDKIGINSFAQLFKYEKKRALIEKKTNGKNIFVYGAGAYGKVMYNQLSRIGLTITSYIVSDGYKEGNTYLGVPIIELHEYKNTDDNFILVAADPKNYKIFKKNLKISKIANYLYTF